ncbi:hypothetical protein GCK32_018158, partial [Trichostrongylus colubriformis]
FQETHVFKFARKTITRFICQIRICVRTEECKKLTPPTTCPTLEQRLLKTKGLREPPGNGVKKILSLDEPDSNSVDAGVESFPNDVHPPASKPENDFKQNTTLGSIYSGYGYDSPRNRRELTEPRITTSKGYPEVGLVGELRVLDSPEDVMYFGEFLPTPVCKCLLSLHLFIHMY